MKDNKSKSIGVRLTPVEKEKLEKICIYRQENNLSAVIRMLILDEYEKIKKEIIIK